MIRNVCSCLKFSLWSSHSFCGGLEGNLEWGMDPVQLLGIIWTHRGPGTKFPQLKMKDLVISLTQSATEMSAVSLTSLLDSCNVDQTSKVTETLEQTLPLGSVSACSVCLVVFSFAGQLGSYICVPLNTIKQP